MFDLYHVRVRVASTQCAGVHSTRMIFFFGARGRREGETLSRHVVSTQCAVGLRMFLSTLYIYSSNNLNMLFLNDPKMSSLFITPERA